MGVTYIEHPQDRYFEVVIDGRIGKEDLDRIMPQIQAFIEAHGAISVLEVVRSLGFVNLPAALPHMGLGISAIAMVKRAAVVTDLAWLGPATRAAALVSPIEMQVFGLAEEQAARAWLLDTGAGPD